MANEFITGIMAGQQYQQNEVKFKQEQQLFPLELESAGIKVEDQKLALDNAKLLRTRQDQVIKLMSMRQGVSDPAANPVEDTANLLTQMGNVKIQSGLIEEGAKDIATGARLQQQHEKIVLQETEGKIKKFQLAADLMVDVNDQQSFDTMKTMYQSIVNEKLDPKIANQPYSPQLIHMLRQGAQTQLQAAQTRAANARESASRAETQVAEARVPYVKALREEADARTIRLRKAGAEGVLPSTAERKEATDLITAAFPGIDKAEATTLGLSIAEDAKARMKDGTRASHAFQQAFDQAKTNGVFDGIKQKAPKNQDVVNRSVNLIDELIQLTESSKGDTVGITGWAGVASRAKETVGNIAGLTSETKAHDFQAKLSELQLILPKALDTGQAKYKVAEIQKVARGLNAGDTPENTVSALRQLRSSFAPGAAPVRPAAKASGIISLDDYLKLQE